MSWDTISLGDIAVTKGGSVDPRKHLDEVFELYSIPAFDAGAPEIVSGVKIGSSKKKVQENDVLISRIVPHIRRAWVVGAEGGCRQIASGEWIIFRHEDISPQYLRRVLTSDAFHTEFMRTVSGVGGSLLRARPSLVYNIQIPLPPLAEQKRIAAILDAADALRAKRRESLEQLDTLLQSTFLEMFGDPVTNPMGWAVEPLNKLSDILTGFAFPSGEYLPKNTGQALCRGINIGIGKIDWKDRADWTEEPDPKIEKFRLEANDIVLAMDRPWISSGLKIAIISESDLPSMLVQRVSRIRCFDHATRPLIYALISSPIFNRHCNPTETTVPHISPKDIKSFPIIQPPLDLQQRFASIVESVEQQKAAQRKHLEELDTLFASLQQRAFSGEL